MSADDLPARLRALAQRLEDRGLSAAEQQALARALAGLEAALEALEHGGKSGGAGTRATPAGGSGRDASPGSAGTIRIWCDGSCSPNPGAGGWGAIVERDGRREELSGASPASTNNIMEMTAAIEALRHTPPGSTVHVATDSQYLANGAEKWLHGWKRKGWRTATGGAVKNRELWETLDALLAERRVTWEWVRGHVGHPENERCDALANAAREDLKRGG